MFSQFNEDEFLNNLSQEEITILLTNDFESISDKELICKGYKLHTIWENIDFIDYEIESSLLRERMRQVYRAVLARAQNTFDLERLALLIPTLPYFIYAPELPKEEDCFEPVDDLIWSFAEKVSRISKAPQWIVESAVNTLLVETEGVEKEVLMVEPVYRWAISQMCNV